MAERSRRPRRKVSDITEGSPEISDAESEEFEHRKSETMKRAARQETTPTARSKRSFTYTTSQQNAHSPSNDNKQSIKLTMKVAPSKLREVMRATELESLQDTLGGGKVLDAPRSSRRAQQAQANARVSTRPKYTEVHESDLDEDEEEEDEGEDSEANEDGDEDVDVEDTTMNDFDEIGAEAEGNTDDEDIEMEDEAPPVRKAPNPPKAPKITLKTPAKKGQVQTAPPKVIVTPANVGPVLSVEDQEMQDEEDDEEEDDEDEDDITNAEDETNINDEDAEGEDETLGEGGEVEGDEVDEDEDDDLDSDDEDDDDDEPGSGAATPDPTKLTSRQRGRPAEPLMALDMAPQQRKFFTDEEKAMKKDEHARKRKELTKRKTQEEKTAALNRLLKPQVSKTRGAAPKAETLAAQMQAVAEEEEIEQKADPHYTRWVSNKDGIKLGVPEEWLDKNVGKYFGPPISSNRRALVQEMD